MSFDFRINYLRQTCANKDERINVLIRFRREVSSLGGFVFPLTSYAGDVASATVPVGDLDELREHPDVLFVEAARQLKDETDVSSEMIGLTVAGRGRRKVPGGGRGALIGIIDSGFDLTHPCFTDADGRTRILAAWDQKNMDDAKLPAPEGFGYGVEYTRDAINERIAAKNILLVKGKEGAGAHGTNVAGIAAGYDLASGVYSGIAPEAELILVTYRSEGPVGGSASVFDAINYIRECASGRPVVINISQGDNLGAHDGTSLLERGIDNVVAEGRVLVVVSAGNQRRGPQSQCHHARGCVEPGRDLVLPFALAPDDKTPVNGDTIELWYRGGDRFAFALRAPDGVTSEFVAPGESKRLEPAPGARALTYSELHHPVNGDNHIGIILEKGDGWTVGTWELILRPEEVSIGDFDVWADRFSGVTLIDFKSHQCDAATVTLPGNARRAITVGSFVSRPAPDLEPFDIVGATSIVSSLGPTRDGRVKPDIMAPGSMIKVPRMREDNGPHTYTLRGGTSMAAAHVTGAIALYWGLWPALTAEQIRDTLYSTARNDTFTGATPNTNWGHGKLDVEAAYLALSNLVGKGETAVSNEQVIEVEFEAQPKPGTGEMAAMRVRIEARGKDLVITGRSGDAEYVGNLVLRRVKLGGGTLKKGDEALPDTDAEREGVHHNNNPNPGGDECYVLNPRPPHWEDPCPNQ